jgi:Fur family transcriptional regulator, ferric uptake regulator
MTKSEAERSVRAALAGRPHRMTKQRLAIVEELAAIARFATAKELHRRLARKRSGIGLATVYRTLETLESIGVASARAQARGEAAYLFCAREHHHHAVCTKCGKVEDVPCRSIGRIARGLTAALRFTTTQHRFEFFGLCDRCS